MAKLLRCDRCGFTGSVVPTRPDAPEGFEMAGRTTDQATGLVLAVIKCPRCGELSKLDVVEHMTGCAPGGCGCLLLIALTAALGIGTLSTVFAQRELRTPFDASSPVSTRQCQHLSR